MTTPPCDYITVMTGIEHQLEEENVSVSFDPRPSSPSISSRLNTTVANTRGLTHPINIKDHTFLILSHVLSKSTLSAPSYYTILPPPPPLSIYLEHHAHKVVSASLWMMDKQPSSAPNHLPAPVGHFYYPLVSPFLPFLCFSFHGRKDSIWPSSSSSFHEL